MTARSIRDEIIWPVYAGLDLIHRLLHFDNLSLREHFFLLPTWRFLRVTGPSRVVGLSSIHIPGEGSSSLTWIRGKV